MSRTKKLCILLAVLVVICGITVMVSRSEEKKEKIKNSDEIILAIDSDAVTALSWECNGLELSFHKDADVWKYDGDENFPLSDIAIYEILENFNEFGVSFKIEDPDSIAQYGLSDPVCTVNITTENESYVLNMGGYSTMDSLRYVSIGDGNVYLASEDPLEAFEVSIEDLIDNDEIAYITQANRISFSGIQSGEIIYCTDSETSDSKVLAYYLDGKKLDSSLVESYLSGLRSTSLSTFVTYNASEEDLSACGLDEPDLTISIEYIETENGEDVTKLFEISVGRDKEELAQDADGEDVYITKYLRVGDSQIIYQIVDSKYNALLACSYNDLRQREVFTGSIDSVSQIVIEIDNSEYLLHKQTEVGESLWYYKDDEAIDISEIESAIIALKASSAERFTDQLPSGKKEITLIISFDDEEQADTKIDIYRYDGNDCLIVIDDTPFALITRSSAVNLIEAMNSVVL